MGAAVVHFALLFGICSSETFRLVRDRLTLLPIGRPNSARSESVRDGPATAESPRPSTLQKLTKTYLHLAGINAGYGFFAPNVPDGYQLTIELIDQQERVFQSGLISPKRGETGLRLASFLDALGRTASGDVRDIMFHLLGKSLLDEHPEAARVRLSIETISLSSLAEYQAGGGKRVEQAYAYEFSRTEPCGPAAPE